MRAQTRLLAGACTAAVAVIALSVLPLHAAAERPKNSGLRQSASAQPVKECIRFNGRHGYYGNPWCTLAEQDRWDRWEAARLKVR